MMSHVAFWSLVKQHGGTFRAFRPNRALYKGFDDAVLAATGSAFDVGLTRPVVDSSLHLDYASHWLAYRFGHARDQDYERDRHRAELRGASIPSPLIEKGHFSPPKPGRPMTGARVAFDEAVEGLKRANENANVETKTLPIGQSLAIGLEEQLFGKLDRQRDDCRFFLIMVFADAVFGADIAYTFAVDVLAEKFFDAQFGEASFDGDEGDLRAFMTAFSQSVSANPPARWGYSTVLLAKVRLGEAFVVSEAVIQALVRGSHARRSLVRYPAELSKSEVLRRSTGYVVARFAGEAARQTECLGDYLAKGLQRADARTQFDWALTTFQRSTNRELRGQVEVSSVDIFNTVDAMLTRHPTDSFVLAVVYLDREVSDTETRQFVSAFSIYMRGYDPSRRQSLLYLFSLEDGEIEVEGSNSRRLLSWWTTSRYGHDADAFARAHIACFR